MLGCTMIPLQVVILVSVLISLKCVCAQSSLGNNTQILWQFQRESGLKLYGANLARKLDDVRIIEGDSVTFIWAEGQLHDLTYTQSEESFNNCFLQNTEKLGDGFPTIRGNITITPTVGTHYFFDSVNDNCISGQLKIAVLVFKEEDFVELAPTPPSTVTQATSTSDKPSVVVNWRPQIANDIGSIEITADDVTRFTWDPPLSPSVVQVTKDGYDTCSEAGNIVKSWSGRSVGGNVSVVDLAVGSNYFISTGPAHCSGDLLKLHINVVPGSMLIWATAWTESGMTTSQPVYLTLLGYRPNDPVPRPWTSPAVQINQRAKDDDLSQLETFSITDTRSLFELYIMDVGILTGVRIRVADTESWQLSRIRIENRDKDVPSITFECADVIPGSTIGGMKEQFCMIPQTFYERPESPEIGSPATDNNCTCFRQFTVVQDRVLVCTSDGCFSTNADGTSGWSEIREIQQLLGVGADSRLYAKNTENKTVVSDDVGLNWQYGHGSVTIEVPVINYIVDVHNLTKTPRDEHILHHNGVEWGLTSGGVHYSKDGSWTTHAVWACGCDGVCGLKCNQPSPNLL